MLSVTNLTGDTEPLINIQNAEIQEEVNGGFSLSLTSFFNDNPGYDLLEEESVVDIGGHEFRLKGLTHKRTNKTIRGNHVFFDLLHHQVEGIQGGTRYANEQAAFILKDTDWTYEIQGTIPPALFLDAFGNSNALNLIRVMCDTFGCEVKIMPNKHLIFAKEVGEDHDFQFRYKHNIKDLTRNVDTTDLYTAVVGHGGNGVKVEYRAPTWELYAINGKPRYMDPIVNEEMTSQDSLYEHIKQELGDKYLPKITIDVEVSEMNAQGFVGVPELGDRIWLMYEPLGLAIQTRIMSRRYKPVIKGNTIEKKNMVVTLSNVKQTFSDVLTEVKIEIDENAKEHRSRIHQTNERITLEVQRLDGDIVEAYSRIELEADRITSEVARLDEGILEAYSRIEQTADHITSEVSRLDGDIVEANSRITQTAESIRLDINKIDEDMNELNTQVQFNAGEISSKVSVTDYNGNEMISRINQTATTIKLDAQKIEMTGITEVAEQLHIGGRGTYGDKSLIFSNDSGIDVHNSTSMELIAFGNIYLNGSDVRFDGYYGGNGAHVDFSTARSIDWGDHAPPAPSYVASAGNADRLDGYHASHFSVNGHDHDSRYSQIGHSHYGDYIRDYFGQYLDLYIDNTTNRLVVRKNGSIVGSTALT